MQTYTEYTITNALRLKKEIQTVKETHVAFDDEEIERDIFCIGASIVKNEQIIIYTHIIRQKRKNANAFFVIFEFFARFRFLFA